jgi:hypothetical protein
MARVIHYYLAAVVCLMGAGCSSGLPGSSQPTQVASTPLANESPLVKQYLTPNSVLFVAGGIASLPERITVDLDSGLATVARGRFPEENIFDLPPTIRLHLRPDALSRMRQLAATIMLSGATVPCGSHPFMDAMSSLAIVMNGQVRHFDNISCASKDTNALFGMINCIDYPTPPYCKSEPLTIPAGT